MTDQTVTSEDIQAVMQRQTGQPAHMAAPPMIGTPPDGYVLNVYASAADAKAAAKRANDLEEERCQPGEQPRLKFKAERIDGDDDDELVATVAGDSATHRVVSTVANANKGGPNIGTPEDGQWPMDTTLSDDD